MNQAPQKQAPTPFQQGKRAATKWEAPPCPFPADSPAAGEWANGLLDGRKMVAYNVRSSVQCGMTARWVSEAISSQMGMSLGQALLPLGAEALVYFRIGFILQGVEIPLPDEATDYWVDFAKMTNRSMQGKSIEETRAETHWLNTLAREQALHFIDLLMHGVFLPSEVSKGAAFSAQLSDVFQYMGAAYEPKEWLPRRDQ